VERKAAAWAGHRRHRPRGPCQGAGPGCRPCARSGLVLHGIPLPL